MPDAWWNGEAVTGIPPASRSVAYGDGLFETVAVRHGSPRLLAFHRERLHDGCRRLAIALDPDVLDEEVERTLTAARQVAAQSGDACHGVLKIMVVRGGFGRGYGAPGQLSADRLLRWVAGDDPRFRPQAPAVMRLCRLRLALQPALAGLKHLNRLEQVMARSEWRDPAIAEGLLLDARGHLIEGVATNLFLVIRDRIVTPRLDSCGVAGVMRRLVIEQLAPACGYTVEESVVELDALYAADELFVTNSLIGIRAAARVDCLGLPGAAVAAALQRRLMAYEEQGCD